MTFSFPEPNEDNNFTTCPECGKVCGVPDWHGSTTYLWANQFGWEKRLFCRACGCIVDFNPNGITHIVNRGNVDKLGH